MSSTQNKTSVYFWEDFTSSKLRESHVGRKGLSLFKMKDMDIPVPEFFVISPNVFKDVVFEALDKDFDKLLHKGRNPEEEEVEKSILKVDFSDEVKDQIKSAYTRISGFTDAWVSVRSSVVFPSNPEISFSGVFLTELNVRHFDQLLDSIKEIYSSMFTDDVVAYASNMGIDLSEVRMSVVVQRMVQAEVSGVAFTLDPITQDPSRLSIEAVFGLGDVISSGLITPDTYVLNKKDLSIVEKHIAPQEWMKVRTISTGRSKSSEEKISISNSWSHRQKLDERYIKEVSKISLVVENKSREYQSVEWVQSGGRIWILQNKPLKEVLKQPSVQMVREDRDTLNEVITAFVQRYRDGREIEGKAIKEAQKIVKKNQHEYTPKVGELIQIAKKQQIEKPNTQDGFVLSGIGASFGSFTGKTLIVKDGRKGIAVTKDDVLVIDKYANEMESSIIKAGAVIMDTGGLTSDTAILCREFNIPAIVGAVNASSVLKDGEYVRVDGNMGSVYRQEKQQVVESEVVHPVVDAYKSENLSGVDLSKEKEEPVEEEIPVDRKLLPTATKVFTNSHHTIEELKKYVGNSHGIFCLDLDKIMIENGRHMLAYVEDKKFVEYSKDISEKLLEYIDLAMGNEVVISIGSHTVNKFRELTKGKTFENSELSAEAFGLSRLNSSPEFLDRAIRIVKRIRNVYKKRNVHIAVHSPMSGSAMKEFKKTVSSVGLRRCSTFKVFAILDNPTEVILADEIVDAKIDGIIINTPYIAKQMQGIKLDDSKARYDISTNSVIKVIDNVVDIVKKYKIDIVTIVEDSEQLVKHSVDKGVYGVSTNPENIIDVRKQVSKQESNLILGK